MTEQRILESIANEEFYRDDPHLITVLSTTLDEDEIDLDETTEEKDDSKPPRSRKEKFLEAIEKSIDQTNPVEVERLEHVKLQVIDHLKVTKSRKTRSRTDSKRKGEHEGEEELAQHSSRPRTVSPK